MKNSPPTVPTAILFDSCSIERDRIKTFILNHHLSYVSLVGEYACPQQTLQAIAKYKPNVLFLSAQSSSTSNLNFDQNAFFIITELYKTDFMPHIVLTNPTISTSTSLRSPYNIPTKTHFFVKTVNGKCYQFETSSVAYIKSDGNCAIIYFLSGEVKNITNSLCDMEHKLISFIRIGRSYLINLSNVKSVDYRKRMCTFTEEVNVILNRNNLLFLKNYIENQ